MFIHGHSLTHSSTLLLTISGTHRHKVNNGFVYLRAMVLLTMCMACLIQIDHLEQLRHLNTQAGPTMLWFVLQASQMTRTYGNPAMNERSPGY